MVGANGSEQGKGFSLEASLGFLVVTAQVVVGTDIGLRNSYLSALYQSLFGTNDLRYGSSIRVPENLPPPITPEMLGSCTVEERTSWQFVKEIPVHPACDTRKPEFYQRTDASRAGRSYSFQ